MNIELNTVYNCDCLELMKEMVKQGIVVDWLITDHLMELVLELWLIQMV